MAIIRISILHSNIHKSIYECDTPCIRPVFLLFIELSEYFFRLRRAVGFEISIYLVKIIDDFRVMAQGKLDPVAESCWWIAAIMTFIFSDSLPRGGRLGVEQCVRLRACGLDSATERDRGIVVIVNVIWTGKREDCSRMVRKDTEACSAVRTGGAKRGGLGMEKKEKRNQEKKRNGFQIPTDDSKIERRQ